MKSLFAIDKGGMGALHVAARDRCGVRSMVAVKRLHPHLSSEPDAVRQFLDESRLALRLEHPNIVRTIDVGQDEQGYYLTMELLRGQSLRDVFRRSQQLGVRIPHGVLVSIVGDALRGLAHLHGARDYDGKPLHAVHRDISPANLFVTYEGSTKLVDFGVAKTCIQSSVTEHGYVKGKWSYVAPETLVGASLDPRVDLWALGVCIWEGLSMRKLFPNDDLALLFGRITRGDIPSLFDVPEKLAAVVEGALQVDPAMRYASAADMLEALEATGVEPTNPSTFLSRLFAEDRREMERRLRDSWAAFALPDSTGAHSLPSLMDGEESVSLGSLDGVVASCSLAPPARSPGRLLLPLAMVVALLAHLLTLGMEATPTKHVGIPPAIPTPESAASVSEREPESPMVMEVVLPASPIPSPSTTVRQTRRRRRPEPEEALPELEVLEVSESSEPGVLTLDARPWAEVRVDGRLLGTTPILRQPLPPGDHIVELFNPELGRRDHRPVRIHSGETHRRRVDW